MKRVFLFLALMLSSYSYAQSGHDHQEDMQKGGGRHDEMHGGGHHGMGGMMPVSYTHLDVYKRQL